MRVISAIQAGLLRTTPERQTAVMLMPARFSQYGADPTSVEEMWGVLPDLVQKARGEGQGKPDVTPETYMKRFQGYLSKDYLQACLIGLAPVLMEAQEREEESTLETETGGERERREETQTTTQTEDAVADRGRHGEPTEAEPTHPQGGEKSGNAAQESGSRPYEERTAELTEALETEQKPRSDHKGEEALMTGRPWDPGKKERRAYPDDYTHHPGASKARDGRRRGTASREVSQRAGDPRDWRRERERKRGTSRTEGTQGGRVANKVSVAIADADVGPKGASQVARDTSTQERRGWTSRSGRSGARNGGARTRRPGDGTAW